MKRLAGLLAGLVMTLIAGAAAAQTAAGDWTGVLAPVPVITFRLAVHLHNSDSGLAGTLDDQSRAAYGLALTDVSLSGDMLSFKVLIPSAPGSFSGKWDAAAGHWVGQWTQGPQSFPLTLAPGVWPPEPTVEDLDGAWDGTLKPPSGDQRVVLHVRTGARGASAWADAPDQGLNGLDVAGLKRDGADFSFAMPAFQAAFAGKVAEGGQIIAGTFTQGGVALPLTLTRRAPGAAAPTPNRPQNPKPPFPYAAEDVHFDGGAPGVKLAGTLTLPPGAGPFPSVVLVSGSGPNTRDEEVVDHKIFLVLADYLTRHGLAVLRYDKRGVGQSTGDYADATTADFADDAGAAVAWLRTHPTIDPARVGLIGHSEGGVIVPIVASRDPKVAFIVMMAGAGVDGGQVLALQGELIAKAAGASGAALADDDALRRAMIAIVQHEKDPAAAKAKLSELVEQYAAAHKVPAASLEPGAIALNTPWFRYFFDYDPAPTLGKVRCPVLAINGSKDLQVPPAQNLPPIRAALAHNPDATVVELPGLNHLFQPATTGSPTEYREIEITIDPAALGLITGWILKHDARDSR